MIAYNDLYRVLIGVWKRGGFRCLFGFHDLYERGRFIKCRRCRVARYKPGEIKRRDDDD